MDIHFFISEAMRNLERASQEATTAGDGAAIESIIMQIDALSLTDSGGDNEYDTIEA